ncbi:MAG: DUF4859 domain-containing protein [Bacteroidaceae bacterium]|nr:DUF4859 domain-containing protein [Bacteroidaceae bacterium]
MKKILFLVPLFALMMGFYSCNDNENVSYLHILTNEELAEMHRQDSIDSVNRSKINANLILDYECELFEGDAYEGKNIGIDFQPIADLFGMTVDELYNGINEGEVEPLFIQGTTHQDWAQGCTANAPWGYWANVDGDACSWGQGSAVFTEWNGEALTCGQMPETLALGDEITVLPGLRYGSNRAVIRLKVKIVKPQEIVAGIVYEDDLTINLTTNAGSYDPHPLEFDYDAVCKAIGVSQLSTDMLVTYADASGKITNKQNADMGFWMDKTGPIGGWGDNASVWLSFGMTEGNTVGVCLMPGAHAEGDVFVNSIGFQNGDKIAMLNITTKVVGYIDPETPPGGDPEDATADITLTKPWTDDYASVSADVRDILRNAFKATTYQIYSAILDGELKMYCLEASEEEPAYTASAPGYWIKADGSATSWGVESVAFVELASGETFLTLNVGNHPDLADPMGFTVPAKMIVCWKGVKVTINLTIDIKPKE